MTKRKPPAGEHNYLSDTRDMDEKNGWKRRPNPLPDSVLECIGTRGTCFDLPRVERMTPPRFAIGSFACYSGPWEKKHRVWLADPLFAKEAKRISLLWGMERNSTLLRSMSIRELTKLCKAEMLCVDLVGSPTHFEPHRWEWKVYPARDK